MAILNSSLERDRATGRPELRLTYRMNQYDTNSKTIRLKKLRSLSDFASDRIPVYYSLEQGAPSTLDQVISRADLSLTTRPPVLTIIAAPGISIELSNFPTRWWVASTATPSLQIVRVQNARVVPTIGAPSSISALLTEYFVDTSPHPSIRTRSAPQEGQMFDSRSASAEEIEQYLYGLLPNLSRRQVVRAEFDLMRLREGDSPLFYTSDVVSSVSLLHIKRQANGVIFTHPFSSQALYVEVPMLHQASSRSTRSDHNARFAFQINSPSDNPNRTLMPLVTIIKSPEVQVTLTSTERGLIIGADSLRERFRRSQVFFSIFDADFDAIPPQGTPLRTTGLRRTQQINFVPDPLVEVYRALFDLGLGFIPYVGDAADLSEFIYALSTDRDRWGRAVSTLDKVLMGVGTVLPFVGIAALRSGPRLAAAFGRYRRVASRLGSAVEQANFTPAEREFLLDMHRRLQQGRRLTAAQARRADELLRRIPQCLA